jgi:hypothetical protein
MKPVTNRLRPEFHCHIRQRGSKALTSFNGDMAASGGGVFALREDRLWSSLDVLPLLLHLLL